MQKLVVFSGKKAQKTASCAFVHLSLAALAAHPRRAANPPSHMTPCQQTAHTLFVPRVCCCCCCFFIVNYRDELRQKPIFTSRFYVFLLLLYFFFRSPAPQLFLMCMTRHGEERISNTHAHTTTTIDVSPGFPHRRRPPSAVLPVGSSGGHVCYPKSPAHSFLTSFQEHG